MELIQAGSGNELLKLGAIGPQVLPFNLRVWAVDAGQLSLRPRIPATWDMGSFSHLMGTSSVGWLEK